MKKLGKKLHKISETIEAYACKCNCSCSSCSCSMLRCLGDYGVYQSLYNNSENSVLSSNSSSDANLINDATK